jgi:hypothetical protein
MAWIRMCRDLERASGKTSGSWPPLSFKSNLRPIFEGVSASCKMCGLFNGLNASGLRFCEIEPAHCTC